MRQDKEYAAFLVSADNQIKDIVQFKNLDDAMKLVDSYKQAYNDGKGEYVSVKKIIYANKPRQWWKFWQPKIVSYIDSYQEVATTIHHVKKDPNYLTVQINRG